ncbi:DUF1569 domain-containing protein [Rheinheimera sp. NSM]|uniref:DUF1569 domain-containing protein n=1 Tax=Rheinheimera sp. NSM TaxID=3457884 RepID=UPI00403745C2
MNRRQFLTGALCAPVVLVLGVKSVATLRHYPLGQMLREIKALPADRLSSSGNWNVSEIFQHCAQSIRYSMTGYPQAKPAWFQLTAGKAAFNTFVAKGSMDHPLDEAIPGAPELVTEVPNSVAQAELVYVLEQFIAWQGRLEPHFAFGELNKIDYFKAHYLHLQNHLSQISLS